MARIRGEVVEPAVGAAVEPEPVVNDGTKASEGSKGGPFKVVAGTTDAQIRKLVKDETELRWDYENFRELEGGVLNELPRLALDSYFTEFGLWKRKGRREADEAQYGKMPIIDVMGRSADIRMKVEGLPRYLHPHWEDPDNVAIRERAGYVVVDKARFPEVVAGDSHTGNNRVNKNSKGEVEAILMACPNEDYEGYIQGMSSQSTGRVRTQATESLAKVESESGVKQTEFREEAPQRVVVKG